MSFDAARSGSEKRVRRGWRLLAIGSACLLPAAFVLSTGCNSFPSMKNPAAGGRVASVEPTAADLVKYLNYNAQRMQSLECQELLLDASQRMQSIGLKGQMVCQKPNNFRLVANAAGQPAVDLGSNNQEFWYWISKNNPPYLFHCSHQGFAQGRARMPFPFQPEWIIEALGMAEYDLKRNYQVVASANTIELIEPSTSPQGKAVRKVTVFNRAPNHRVQVAAHILQDASGREICGAYITEERTDPATGATYPHRLKLVWPAEHMKLEMRLEDVTLNSGLDNSRAARLFARPAYQNIRNYDLAQAQGDPYQRVGGTR